MLRSIAEYSARDGDEDGEMPLLPESLAALAPALGAIQGTRIWVYQNVRLMLLRRPRA